VFQILHGKAPTLHSSILAGQMVNKNLNAIVTRRAREPRYANLTRLLRSSDSISSTVRPNQKRILRPSTGDR
jgi:hypothetical protein